MADIKIEIPQDEVDAIIRNKRKARDPKACYACHRRKVKCDRGLPCDSCIKRDHPQLCSYERPSKRRHLAINSRLSELDPTARADTPAHSPTTTTPDVPGPQNSYNVSVPKEQWDRMNTDLRVMQETINDLRAGVDHVVPDDKPDQLGTGSRSDESEREGIHAPSGQMGTMHLGSRSVLAYMMGQGRSKSSQEAAQTLLEENILPKLGLDNETTTYPFVDLWSTDASAYDVGGLLKLLPDDDQCRALFVSYRDVACTIYPVVSDTTYFENTLNGLLQNRARSGGVYVPENDGHDRPFGVTLSWLALLFSVLASGCQCSEMSAKERELTSQVYICCSYQALRMTNFMVHPSLETIQTFLIIGNVLSFNMNPGVAYIILGMALRMAYTIGLQIDPHRLPPSQQYLRRRVWWALAWQDSHFSLSYDRPSSTCFCGSEIPYRRTSTPGHRSYAESMYRIIRLTQEIIAARIARPKSNLTWSAIQSYKEEIVRIMTDAALHLRDRNFCGSQVQHLERLALKLHSSYITSELCRPALQQQSSSTITDAKSFLNTGNPISGNTNDRNKSPPQNSPGALDPLPVQLKRECIANLQYVIDAYLELFDISSHASRSWIGIQRAISAAFLLGMTQESHHDQHIQTLLRRLEQVIGDRTRMEPAFFDAPDLQSPVLQAAVNGTARSRDNSLTDVSVLNQQPPKAVAASGPHWARSMTQSLKALGKMNAALASPLAGGVVRPPATYVPSALNSGSGTTISEIWSGQISPGHTGLMMPATPDSSGSSGEWNYGNLGERAADYVQPALWGSANL